MHSLLTTADRAMDGRASVQFGDVEHQSWLADFQAHVNGLPELLAGDAKRALSLTDLRDAPERFFSAHHVLSEFATRLGPGFGIRFTVQYNLFAGSVLALGTTEHLDLLEAIQESGGLGCFGLTERFAGVNSGLVVETECAWNEASQGFTLHSPYEGAVKNWISQGCTADWAVVIANLVMPGKSHGPHAFLMRLRSSEGELVEGVTIGDMGPKTIGNDLDNAWIKFDRVALPKTSLLNKYCDIIDGRYVQKVKGVSNIDMIGQRLYTGRLVIADSAITFAQCLFRHTREYSNGKECWAPGGRAMLSSIPQLKALYEEADLRLAEMSHFLDILQTEMRPLLREGRPPDRSTVDCIAAAKVKCIETAIELCFRLKQEVGSFALMSGTGFEKMDYLQCCKFAEGDSRILMQKLARDRMAAYKKAPGQGTAEELQLCDQLHAAMRAGGPDAWNDNWKLVYQTAETVINRIIMDRQQQESPQLLASKL
eukprot:CAMPEP_0177778082 /NCGR_PEP_ID=MMETSP0491_2-20121128/15754_1 /TAXON_ID=63592 /ORGANISM="Tetraselmis chuii, Strain PLY429" /LENGTH=482 /DNA_ID=CAMNT_0019297311 /DNA_START=210 /DNA_END=1659 /DNA_ORIENTATION=-